MSAIEVESFSCFIGGKRILERVTFSVEEGEFFSIIGPNGAGKTTLLKCMLAMLPGEDGQIRLKGKDLRCYPRRELATQVSYVPQWLDQPFPFTVREFVMMGRYPYLSPFTSVGQRDREAVDEALDVTGIAQLGDRLLESLSGGERQRMLVAAALAQGAKVMLLDEPTTFLDPKHSAEVYSLLGKLNREKGTTIVSVTHDINAACMMSNQILALKEGRVVYLGPPADLMRNEVLKRIFDKEFVLVKHPVTGGMVVLPDAYSAH